MLMHVVRVSYIRNVIVTIILVSTEVEMGPKFKSTAEASAEEEYVAATVGHISENKPLVLL